MDKGSALMLAGLGVLILGAWAVISSNANKSTADPKLAEDSSTQSVKESDTRATIEAYDERVNKKITTAKASVDAGLPAETGLEENASQYDFVAGTATSYSELARQAVAKTDKSLTAAERAAAEAKLAQDAGSPYLDVTERVTLKKDAVKSAASWARSLTSEEKAAWQYYADQIAW